jgi:hypothetical protein
VAIWSGRALTGLPMLSPGPTLTSTQCSDVRGDRIRACDPLHAVRRVSCPPLSGRSPAVAGTSCPKIASSPLRPSCFASRNPLQNDRDSPFRAASPLCRRTRVPRSGAGRGPGQRPSVQQGADRPEIPRNTVVEPYGADGAESFTDIDSEKSGHCLHTQVHSSSACAG